MNVCLDYSVIIEQEYAKENLSYKTLTYVTYCSWMKRSKFAPMMRKIFLNVKMLDIRASMV